MRKRITRLAHSACVTFRSPSLRDYSTQGPHSESRCQVQQGSQRKRASRLSLGKVAAAQLTDDSFAARRVLLLSLYALCVCVSF